MDTTALENAWTALQQYHEGSGRGALVPIDEAIASALGNVSEVEKLEQRLLTLLNRELSKEGKEYICRKLAFIGSAKSVEPLAALLKGEQTSEAARTALQAIPCAEAGQALLEHASKSGGAAKVGALNALGMRRDQRSVPLLAGLLKDPDPATVAAAAAALGEIGTRQASEALAAISATAAEPLKSKIADARLACAERLLSIGSKADALVIYRSLTGPEFPKHVRLAANRGLLTSAR